jgi:chlorobactene glucosyltransferase
MSLLLLLFFALPWAVVLLVSLFVFRMPSELPPPGPGSAAPPPVSVIVPARDEAANIEACLGSLVRSRYPDFEVIVVDDASEDGTGDLARSVGQGNACRLAVLDGAPLPAGWLGKPWACWQGALAARGAFLLFTDSDTIHGPELLARAVRGIEQERADLLTVVGSQRMETFWERIVQPQVFFLLFFRFPRFERAARTPRWRTAIANGQFMLFRKEAYERIGGHAAVRDEVVEDLALAQRLKRAALALRIRGAANDLSTRMYRSLGELVAGWSKNLVMGGLQTLSPRLRPLAPPVALLAGVALWLFPPAVLSLALAGAIGSGQFVWAALACALSAVTWAVFTARMGAPAAYGLLYPLGAAVVAYIFARSWARGRRVEWKGRRYELPPASERP